MKTKFSKKLLALFLAVLMALSTFTGALTAFAANAENDYHDANAMATNALGWVELTDEQTCEALLDYVDDVLGNVNLPVNVYMDYTVIVIDIHGYIDSVSGIIDIARQAQDLLDNNRTLINMNGGDLKNIDLSAFARLSYNSNANESQCGRSYREVNTAKDIVKALFSAIYRNTANWNGNKAIVRQFLRGSLDLGIVGNYLNIWNLLNDGIFKNLWNGGMPSGYESNLVFNIVAKLITEMTDWFTETEKANIYNQVEGYDLDTMLFKALQNSLLRKINVNVTYPDRTQSVDRYKEGNTDPHLFYTTDGNVYIFMYDENLDGLDDANLTITPTTNLFTFSLQALKIAWRTVLQPTLGQLNSAVKDYDWDYKIYATEQFGWDYDDIASNYTAAKVQAWAASASIDLDAVKSALSYNRDLVEDPQYNWRDIDSTRLFNMLRRSPLMVYYFNEVTGPLNTNFACTGTPNMDAFMDDLISNNTYTSILAGLNDCLIAAVKDFLPEYADVTSLTPCNTTDAATIATTLVGNASKVVQYIADATDKNILSGFYHTYGDAAVLSEANFEEAMLPFLIACLENNLEDLLGFIHKDKWDACKDAEGVAVVALEEYLSFSLPDRDYSSLITKDENGYYNVTLESAILPMVRDAVGYVMMQYVPVNDGAGNAWSVYDADVQTYAEQQASGTDIFTLLNSVVCYYATTKGVAPLLGLCTTSGVSTITTSNTIWQNFDLIVNKLFPIFGELQYGVAGSAFNSYDLIWNDLVSGILNIADIHTASNGGGITNFVYRLATIIGSNPISTKGIDLLAYDFVKDLLNALFNARYTNQTFYGTPVIPNATSNHPFHDAIQRDVIAGDGKNDTSLGIIGMAIVNFIEFAGYGSYPETVWDGAMFIVQALASLIPGFCPQLGNYTVGDADLSIKDSTLVNYNAGSTINNTLTVANSGVGVNRFVLNEDRATQTQLKRSYIQVTDITADKGTFTFGGYNTRIAPESDLDISVTGSISGDEFANNAAIVTFTVKYKIVDSNGNNFVDSVDTGDTTYNQEYSKEVYFYVSTNKDWYTLTYSDSTTSGFTTDLDAANSQNNAQIGAYSSMTRFLWSQGTTIFANKKAALQYPNEVIVRTSELGNINYHVFLDINYDVKKSIDGIIASSDDFGGTDYFAVTCDKVTGDLTNVFYYDYYQYAYTERTVTDADGTEYTVRDIVYDENGNPTGGHWVTDDPLSRNAVLDLVNSDETVVDYRFHVVVPHDQITTTGLPIDNGNHFVPASIIEDKNADGTYNCIYLKKDTDNYKQCFEYSKQTASDVTLSSGIQGIVLSMQKIENITSGDYKVSFLEWDQETQVVSGKSEMTYTAICANPRTFNIPIYVADDSELADAHAKYIEGVEFLNNYKSTDLENAALYNYYKTAVLEGLAAEATPISNANALTLGSTKAYLARTTSTTDFVGDVAYNAATEATLSGSDFAEYKASLFFNNGVYYQTRYQKADGTVVYDNIVFENDPVDDNDVTATGTTITVGTGTAEKTYDIYTVNSTGQKVVKIKVAGEDATEVWHVLNAVQYETAWADAASGTTAPLYTTPYKYDTTVPAKTLAGDPLYNEISYVYRDAENKKVTSQRDWTIKICETDYTAIPDPASRGVFAVAADKLEYARELALESLNVSFAHDIFTNVYVLRGGLDVANFDVVRYELMATAGRQAENLISIDPYYTYTYKAADDESDAEPAVIMACVQSQAADLLKAYNTEHETDLKLWELTATIDYDLCDVTSSTTTFQLKEALRIFNIYLSKVLERGYLGDKLEEEISCAVNGKSCETKDVKTTPYTDVTVDTANATYTVAGTTYSASSNPDGVTYSDETWVPFIAALNDAVVAATAGNTTYTYKNPAKYVASDKDSYIYNNTSVYSIRKALMFAENNLAEVEAATGFNVTAYVGALTTPTDTVGKYATTGAVVSITTADGTVISATTDNAGKFTLEGVPNGVYTATITYKYGFDRTFTIVVNGADVESTTMVGIVPCDFSKDGTINVSDYLVYAEHVNETSASSPNYDLGIDISRDGTINVSDYMIYSAFVNRTAAAMTYTDITVQ